MDNQIIEKTIEIKAPLNKVWRVFTDPELTKQMGGYYETDWKTGSAIGWKGLDGKLYTNGIILEFEPKKSIKHSLFDMKDSRLLSVITYEFQEKVAVTTIFAKEEIMYKLTEVKFIEVNEGWEIALQAVKNVAEK
ncbi:SRPBCC family protein [Flavitalea sp.]|nr:SRPBCC domain-containing protein [Flavitalea sp.]